MRSYTRSDGTRVRRYRARVTTRTTKRTTSGTTGFIVVVSIVGLTVSSSGSAAEGASSAEKGTAEGGTAEGGEVDLTLSADDVQARFVRAAGRILRSGYSYKDLTIETNKNCAEHSYGRVQEFFQSNPCKWLARAYVVVHKEGSKGSILIDFIWVEMYSIVQADECQQLMETPGAGSVTKLSQEDDSPYKDTYLPLDFYVPRNSGTGAGNIQVQPFIPLPAGITGTVIADSLQALGLPT